VLGPALKLIPIETLRLVVGGLLLVFGLQWLRKAILRASGFKAHHDEAEAYREEQDRAASAERFAGDGVDWYSFTVAFKGVLLEGLEVVFIVLTFGAAQGRIWLAAVAAAAALVVVVAAGFFVRGPLERVPENRIKFAVGLLLSSFGIFWSAEGAGVDWPGSDLAVLGILAFLAVISWLYVNRLRSLRVPAVSEAGA
jgi:uncharacterized membrane protein